MERKVGGATNETVYLKALFYQPHSSTSKAMISQLSHQQRVFFTLMISVYQPKNKHFVKLKAPCLNPCVIYKNITPQTYYGLTHQKLSSLHFIFKKNTCQCKIECVVERCDVRVCRQPGISRCDLRPLTNIQKSLRKNPQEGII